LLRLKPLGILFGLGATPEGVARYEADGYELQVRAKSQELRTEITLVTGELQRNLTRLNLRWPDDPDAGPRNPAMEVQSPKFTRRSTRIRVEIPVSVISLDRRRPFGEKCMVLIVSAQGCGFRASEELQIETPIMLSGLPGGGSVTARVANCLPLGNDGKYFLIGASLYTHGNMWGIENPPEDWLTEKDAKDSGSSAPKGNAQKKSWPYNVFSEGSVKHPGRK
jgi:hypothetical protein